MRASGMAAQNQLQAMHKTRWRLQFESKKYGVEGPRQFYLLKEDDRPHLRHFALINVSDGGHLENLESYELLRRRCRFIIAVDASVTASHSLGSLIQCFVCKDRFKRQH